MIVPSSIGGKTTENVGFFHLPAERYAAWLTGPSPGWSATVTRGSSGRDELLASLAPSRALSRYACVPMVDEWTLLLNNGPLGTDVGVLPSRAAKVLGVRAMRAHCTAGTAIYPARILEVFGPDGAPPLCYRRSIVAADDGGRWVFETSGRPFDFEEVERYGLRRKSDRFTADMLGRYLEALGVPVHSEPLWDRAIVIDVRF